MLCWFLLYNMNQQKVYLYPLPHEPPSNSTLHCTAVDCHRALYWDLCVILITNFSLAIYFTHGNIYMSILLSQFAPPFPSLAVFTSPFSISYLYACTANRFITIIFLGSIYIYVCVNIQYLFFLFLTYFTLYNRIWIHSPHFDLLKLFLFYGWTIFHCIYVPQLLYSSVNGHIGYLHVWLL